MGQKQSKVAQERQAEYSLGQAEGIWKHNSIAILFVVHQAHSPRVWYSGGALNPAAVLCGSSGSTSDLSISASVSSVCFQRNSN
jgi:hypothetical protein